MISIHYRRSPSDRFFSEDGDLYFKAALRDVIKWDNGALVSCGLTVPDDMPVAALESLITAGKAHEVSRETAIHGGCQSYCILRGDSKCSW